MVMVYPEEEAIDFVRFVHTFFHDEYVEPQLRLLRPIEAGKDTTTETEEEEQSSYEPVRD